MKLKTIISHSVDAAAVAVFLGMTTTGAHAVEKMDAGLMAMNEYYSVGVKGKTAKYWAAGALIALDTIASDTGQHVCKRVFTTTQEDVTRANALLDSARKPGGDGAIPGRPTGKQKHAVAVGAYHQVLFDASRLAMSSEWCENIYATAVNFGLLDGYPMTAEEREFMRLSAGVENTNCELPGYFKVITARRQTYLMTARSDGADYFLDVASPGSLDVPCDELEAFGAELME